MYITLRLWPNAIIPFFDEIAQFADNDTLASALVTKAAEVSVQMISYGKEQLRVLEYFLKRYSEAPKEGETAFSSREKLAQLVVFNVVQNYPEIFVTNYESAVCDIAHEHIRLASIGKIQLDTARTRITQLLRKLSEKYWPTKTEQGSKRVNFSDLLLPNQTVAAIANILAVRASEYTEVGVRVGLSLLDNNLPFVFQNKRSTLAFLNLIFAYTILEPDQTEFYDKIYNIFTKAITSPLGTPEQIASAAADLVGDIVHLKHKAIVFPQQTGLLNFDDFAPQHKHYSQWFGLNLLRYYGSTLRLTEEHRYIWHPQFINILDELCESDNMIVRGLAESIDVVQDK